MTTTKENGQTPPNDDLDHLLDSALARYAAVEPRMGLEERVMARLQAGAQQPSRRSWLQWGLATALAVIVVAAALAWKSSRVPHPEIANCPPAAIENPSTQKTNSAPPATGEVAVVKHPAVRKTSMRSAVANTAAAHPKLDQFPSPQPLSTEEIALAQYVKNFPKEAQLVAQAQEEFALETQKIMNDAGSENRPSTSIQQER